MNATEYVEKRPTFTAVQWDGSDSSADWILGVMGSSQRVGDDLMVRDAMDRDTPLAPGVWVLLDPLSGTVRVVEDSDFSARFEPGD